MEPTVSILVSLTLLGILVPVFLAYLHAVEANTELLCALASQRREQCARILKTVEQNYEVLVATATLLGEVPSGRKEPHASAG